MVTDSSRDRFRVVIKASAAAIVHRLIEKKLSCAAACRSVAKALDKAGHRVPGKSAPRS